MTEKDQAAGSGSVTEPVRGQGANRPDVEGFDPAVLFANGFSPGCADLVIGGSLHEIIGRVTAFLLLCAFGKDGKRVFTGASIFLPPADATTVTQEAVFSALLRATRDLRGYPVEDDEQTTLRRLIRIQHSPSLIVDDLVRLAEEQGERRIIAVAEASRYRDPSVSLPPLRQTSCRLPFHADHPRRSDPTCKRINIPQSS